MNTKRVTAGAGCSVGGFALIEASVKLLAGPRPPLDAGQTLVAFMARTSQFTLGVAIADTFLMASLVVFIAGLVTMVRRGRSARGVLAARVAMMAGVAYVVSTLIGDSMDAGTALDAIGTHGDPAVIRALTEAHILLFGPIGGIFIALTVGALAYAAASTRVLPHPIVRFGYVSAALNLLAVPIVFAAVAERVDANAIALSALASFVVWVTVVGVSLVPSLRKRA